MKETPIYIKQKPLHVITIDRKTFVVTLHNAHPTTLEPQDVVETIGTGKNLTDAILIADKYSQEHTDPKNLDNSLAIRIIES